MTRLRRDLSLVTTLALPAWSTGPGDGDDVLAAAAAEGYEGVQVFVPDQAAQAAALGLAASAVGPARTAADIEAIVAMWAGGGAESLTLHLGTGFETRDEGRALVEAMLAAQSRHGVTLYVETHRATLTQDPARTLELVGEYPELRFTADLSHWYTGVEMVYGDFDAKVAALAPVFERCRMIHGRISDPGCIQVAVTDDEAPDYVQHFLRMWSEVMTTTDVDALPFAVELLPARAHYARTVEREGRREEEADRWQQANLLWEMASQLAPAAETAVPA